MKAAVVSDKDYRTGLFVRLKDAVLAFLNEKGFEIELIEVGRDDLAFCMGCFGCWVKKPGECVINDSMAAINRSYVQSDAFVYLSPVVFGQVSANIKNAIDRWLPNILPFFEIRPDGSTMHPARYGRMPKVVFIGYGEDLSEEDAGLFTDIIKKHRKDCEVLIYRGDDAKMREVLGAIKLEKVGPHL
jgi:multimeric flavodoxin WrbA